jgi:predicted outer membrane repeat protein
MKKMIIALSLGAILTVPAAYARIWHVPTDVPTIQAGIDSAEVGDIVEVACGDYYEHDIQMKSGITVRSETQTADCVTVYGQGQTAIEFHYVGACVLRGFTFTGCSGGALRCDHASPTIENCNFVNNTSTDGGGVYLHTSSPAIFNCVFDNNHSSHVGGAIAMTLSVPTVISCSFTNNSSNFGGAIGCEHSSQLTIEGCIIMNNHANHNGGGIFLWMNQSPAFINIYNSTIMNNDAPGGADCWVDHECFMILTNCELDPDYMSTLDGPGTIIVEGAVARESVTWSSVKAMYR